MVAVADGPRSRHTARMNEARFAQLMLRIYLIGIPVSLGLQLAWRASFCGTMCGQLTWIKTIVWSAVWPWFWAAFLPGILGH